MNKKGIDVSSNNGVINWDTIKNAGYEFAIIRMGYGNDDKRQDDSQYLNNIKGCERVGIPYGVYLYSYALNLDDAKSEVAHAKRLLKNVGTGFKYGVWFDMEDADGYKAKHGNPSDITLTNICYTFCDEIEKAGYYTGIYASLWWLNNKINNSKLDRFDKWVAQWAGVCTYKKTYSIWQYSDKVEIGGKLFDGDILKRDFANATVSKEPPRPAKKSNEVIADEVIAGEWGNGEDRKKRLTQAGYDYSTIQTMVNNKLNKKVYYTICYGDTLGKIANKFGTSVNQLVQWNNIQNPNRIYAGQKIRVK